MADDVQARQRASEALWSGAVPDIIIANGISMPFAKPPPPSIVIMAEDGAELLRLDWADGRLNATGDESRWTEAAARFVAEIRKLADG